jgi:hypothetical protein
MRADRSTSSMTQLAYTCFRIVNIGDSPDTAVPDAMTNTSISAFGSPWELTTLIEKRGTT